MPFNCSFPEPTEEIQLGVAAGPRYLTAATGLITSWSTYAGGGPGQSFSFKVYRKVASPFIFTVVAQDTRTLTPGTLNTFPVAIPVQAGDFIGVGHPGGVSTPCVFETGLDGDSVLYDEGSNAPVGGTAAFPGTSESGYRLNVSATVLPVPKVTAISPTQGSVRGARVVVSGENFAHVTGVAFGSTPAASFTVDTETQITAVAPPSTRLASVPVTVTTGAGSATSAQVFTYEGCVVPKLKGKRLKGAKKKARKGNCRVGKVKKLGDATAKTGKVVKQNPKPGKVLAPGAKVRIVLGD